MHTHILTRLLLLALVGMLLVGPVTAGERRPAAGDALATANTRFAWDLYGRLRGGDANLFFSPYSVSTALTMAREGARGRTAAQMDQVLHLRGIDRGPAYAALRRALRAPLARDRWSRERRQSPAYEMRVANRLWGQQGYGFEAPFLATMEKVYGAPLARIDFRDTAGARKAINDWVAEQTKDKIRDIVPAGMPPPLTRLVLANAIYFKAQWQEAFYERNTKPDTFTGPKGKKTEAPFMRDVDHYRYGAFDGVQVLELPYRGGHTSMVIFLPKAVDGLAAVEDKLVRGAADGWIGKLQRTKVDVRLPKFRFTSAQDLATILEQMGMGDAFELEKADFSGMTKAEKLFIAAVLHKAFIAVDEKGTEAAAATVAIMEAGAAPRPEEPVPFTADHPFAFVIRHNQTRSILFAGRVNEPTQD